MRRWSCSPQDIGDYTGFKIYNMPEKTEYLYIDKKHYWVEKANHFGAYLKAVAQWDAESEIMYLCGDEQGTRPEYFDKIHPEPIPEPE